jgi:hypothetical protein
MDTSRLRQRLYSSLWRLPIAFIGDHGKAPQDHAALKASRETTKNEVERLSSSPLNKWLKEGAQAVARAGGNEDGTPTGGVARRGGAASEGASASRKQQQQEQSPASCAAMVHLAAVPFTVGWAV